MPLEFRPSDPKTLEYADFQGNAHKLNNIFSKTFQFATFHMAMSIVMSIKS